MAPPNALAGRSLHRVLAGLLLTSAVVIINGCGRPPGDIFVAPRQPLVWPSPPEPPRIRYVGQLATSADLKPGQSMFQAIGEAMFGRDSVRSMLSPYGVTTDHAQRLFVTDTNAQVVHVFDLSDRTYQRWTPKAIGRAFSQPIGVVYAPAGRLYVSDSVTAAIYVFNDAGTCLGTFGEGLLQRPCGLALDATGGRLFVADAGAHQVKVFSFDGQLQREIGRRGTALGAFNFPTQVVVDEEGRLYVTDTLNFRVQVFGEDLKPIQQIGMHGDLPGSFSQPKGIALDSEGHLYVVDAHFENVQVFDGEGRLLLDFGSEGRGRGQFWLPADVHVDAKDRIWVADSYNRRVQVFEYLSEADR